MDFNIQYFRSALLLAALCVFLAERPAMAADDVSFNTIGYPQGEETLKTSWAGIERSTPERLQPMPTPRYKNLPNVMQVIVMPGDNVGGWSGERAEVSVMKDTNGKTFYETTASGTQYFAFSIMIPHGWQSPEGDPKCHGCQWGIILQLHGPNGPPSNAIHASPTLALSAVDHYALVMNAGNMDVLGAFHNQTYNFADGGAFSFNAWDDFMLRIKFAKDNTGAITIWRRKATETKFHQVVNAQNVPTLQNIPSIENTPQFRALPASGNKFEYWKQGFYRSTSPHVVSVLAETGLVRAGSFAAAEKAAFGTDYGY